MYVCVVIDDWLIHYIIIKLYWPLVAWCKFIIQLNISGMMWTNERKIHGIPDGIYTIFYWYRWDTIWSLYCKCIFLQTDAFNHVHLCIIPWQLIMTIILKVCLFLESLWDSIIIVMLCVCHQSLSTFNFKNTIKKSLCTCDSTPPPSLDQIRGVLPSISN